MKRIIASLVFIITFSISNVFCQSSKNWITDVVASPSLKENLLGDSHEREIQVYLPPSYHKTTKNYPVVYFLMGYNSRNLDPYRKVKSSHFELINNKISERQAKEAIIVYVAGSNKLRGSFYYNSPVTGNWGDFVTKDVITHIDTKYRTISKKESRAICGSSMGGYGALHIAMLHPELFSGFYGISPGVYNDNGFFDSQIVKRKGNLANLLDVVDKFNAMPKEQAHTEFMNFLDTLTNRTLFFSMAYGAAHAPNINQAPYFYPPYKVVGKDTIIIKENWQMWQDGFGGIEKEVLMFKKNLEQYKFFGFACGYNEGNIWLLEGCYYLSEKLKENKINHVLYMHEGTHTSHTEYAFIESALPLLTNALVD